MHGNSAIAPGGGAHTVSFVANNHKRQTSAKILAVIDDIEDRAEQNKVLRETYIKVEKQVMAAAKRGDDEAIAELSVQLSRIGDTFVRYNMGLAGVLVKKYSDTNWGADDIEAYMLACMEALWMSFTTWDPERGTFGTWSRKAIEGALWREVHFHKRPHRKYYEELLLRASVNHTDGLKLLLGREPSDEEIAKATGISLAQLHEVRRRPNISLDRQSYDDERTLLDRIEDAPSEGWEVDETGGLAVLNALVNSASEDEMWLRALAKATADLDDLSLYLVFVRTGLHGWTPENLPEIAAATGIGREIVRRKTHKALESVKAAGKSLPAILN
jgi:DNA-directed RNA polymerase specialized sigma subunit